MSFFDRVVLCDVNLSVPQGGIAVLVGRSGSGKTTLLRAVNRLNDEVPGCRATGRVTLRLAGGAVEAFPGSGPDAVPLAGASAARGHGVQTPQVFPASVYRNIAAPLSVTMNCRVRSSTTAFGARLCAPISGARWKAAST